jgi:cobalt-zinc-cadmium efflux system membrane fusion protein
MSVQLHTSGGVDPSPDSRPAPEATSGGRANGVMGWVLGRVAPNLLVLCALGALAWWGHHTGWKFPRFAELAGGGGEGKDDWCEEHGVPESICVECNEKLLPRGPTYGWCKVHGVHECPLEHPDVAQLKYPPQITAADLERARRALDFADRPVNHPRYKLHQRRLQFPSLDAVARAGVQVTPAWRGRVVEAVAANGEITYGQGRVAALSAPVAGKVGYVLKDLGQPAHKGEVLALIEAAEVGKAKAEFLQALVQADVRAKTVERWKSLPDTLIPAPQKQEAEALLREAQIRLVAAQQALGNLGLPVRAEDFQALAPDKAGERIQFLGLPDDLAARLDRRTTTANLIPVKAPLDLDGVVVARKAVAGEQVEAGKPLFVVADTRQMRLTLQVRQEDARLLRARDAARGTPGQEVRFRPGSSDREVIGEVVWVSTEADEKTRTVQVGADLANPDGQLRANTFGSGRVILREEPQAVLVPSEAVQWVVDSHVVFVRDKNYEDKDAPKVFHARTVRPGAKDGANTEIIAGILPGEVVVTEGSALLRSELLKNSLGEG